LACAQIHTGRIASSEGNIAGSIESQVVPGGRISERNCSAGEVASAIGVRVCIEENIAVTAPSTRCGNDNVGSTQVRVDIEIGDVRRYALIRSESRIADTEREVASEGGIALVMNDIYVLRVK